MLKRDRCLKSQAGYTLVEIAVVMLVVGIMVAAAIQLYDLYNIQRKIDATKLTMTRVTLALDEYKRRYGRYPCPSRQDVDRNSPEYGREGNCTDVSVAPGNCANGICVELSERTFNLKTGAPVTPRVRRGGLPIRTLFLTEDEMYDAYNGQISYAVTELLTDSRTFNVTYGGISVIDDQEPTPNSVIDPPATALYFVFSHGEDNVGAYGRSGNQMSPCNGPMFDNENCNTDAINSLAIYRNAPHNETPVEFVGTSVVIPGGPPPVAAGLNRHFDDFIYFAGMEEQPLWKFGETPGNTTSVHDLLLPSEMIALGSVARTEKINVQGEVNTTGNLYTQDVCGYGQRSTSPSKYNRLF